MLGGREIHCMFTGCLGTSLPPLDALWVDFGNGTFWRWGLEECILSTAGHSTYYQDRSHFYGPGASPVLHSLTMPGGPFWNILHAGASGISLYAHGGPGLLRLEISPVTTWEGVPLKMPPPLLGGLMRRLPGNACQFCLLHVSPHAAGFSLDYVPHRRIWMRAGAGAGFWRTRFRHDATPAAWVLFLL